MSAMNANNAEARMIEAAGNQFHIIDEGPRDAPCVLFSHSIMTGAAMWAGQAELLRGSWRTIRYDARGHGASGSSGAAWSLSKLADDVVALMDALQLERAHFVGLSLGGMIGFDLGSRHAGRILSLALCDARADSPPAFGQPWDARIELAQAQGMQALVEPTMERWFGASYLARPEADSVRAMIAGTSVEGFVATARGLQSFDFLAQLPAIKAPTTLIAGERDGALPGVMRELAEQMPNARYVEIADAGHLPNLENPQPFNQALLQHLGRAG